jgi:hypothetical protein
MILWLLYIKNNIFISNIFNIKEITRKPSKFDIKQEDLSGPQKSKQLIEINYSPELKNGKLVFKDKKHHLHIDVIIIFF